ncbi:MAG: hypothetical protein L6N94_06305, partial [Candidatus Methylarchaceae archaeon HK01M]|nr:hypothetical protein [Candidatus Methylarchaceae archaeon HK01M]
LRSNIVNMCKRDRLRCIFRVSVNEFKQSEKIEDHIIYVAKNVNEARSFKVPFHILEAGRTVEEVLKVKEFCAKKSSIRFIIEFDFNLLRLYDGFHFANYLKSLAILMNICRRRQITTIFSSAARSPNELVPPRVLYSFYKLLGGKMARREVLSEIPYKELLEKLDLGPKIVGG